MVGINVSRHPGSTRMLIIEKCCRWQEKIAGMTEVHNIASRKVLYGFPCIVPRTVTVPLNAV